jgi:AraC-like DNA-binding protein
VTTPSLLAVLDLFSITIFLVFTTVLVIKGVGQLRVVPGLNNRPRYTAARVNAGDLDSHTDRLIRLMATERPYLEPALTVDQLAARLAIPGHVLSQVINSAFKQNFFNYINHHRVEAAKAQLGDPTCNQKTMLQILHEVGFNSKTAFNDAFKRHTSMTPSAFRKRAQGAALS